jgi:hypothetical protein
VLPGYQAGEIRQAFTALQDAGLRNRLAANAQRFGRTGMNWAVGAGILHREYSALLAETLRQPAGRQLDEKVIGF